MRIDKASTQNFQNYEVTALCTNFFCRLFKMNHRVRIKNVVEAEEETGRIVRQVVSTGGYAVITNGSEDIFIDNAAKILMQLPPAREALLKAGFRPKIIVSYEQGVRITNRDPGAALDKIKERLDEFSEVQVSG